MKLLSLRQQLATLELEVAVMKASTSRVAVAGSAETVDLADAADLECAAQL